METLEAESPDPFLNSFSLYLFGWFIFTFLLWILTLRSTVAFSLLFFTLMLAFLFLALAYLLHSNGAPHTHLLRAGGAFGIVAAFAAWYVYSLRVSLSVPTTSVLTTPPSQVQRSRGHGRHQQLLLHPPCRALPLVREGT